MPTDLQIVLTDLADKLGKPVAVNDFDLNLIAASAQDLNVDAYRIESILRRRTPAPVVRMLQDRGLLKQSDPFVLEEGLLPGLRPRMCIPIEVNGRNVAFLWIVLESESGLTPTEYSLARRAAENIKDALQASTSPGADVIVAYSRHLQRLIHPDAVTAGYAVAEFVAEHSLEQFLGLTVSVFELDWPTQPGGPRAELAQVAAPALVGMDPTALLGVVDGAIILVSNEGRHQHLIERIEAVLTRSQDNVAVRGIGSSTTADWKDGLREVYSEAAYAARIAGQVAEAPHRTEYGDLGALVLLRHIPWTLRSVAGISADASALLSEGNAVNIHTLLSYLRWAGDARRTCAELNIHRTTLYYRLDRCRDHIGDALDHGWRRTSLYLALVLSELVGAAGPLAHAHPTSSPKPVPGWETSR
ncbi:helix-turn-helix domain-containing protein [Arthrobacter sp. FW305-123]|nr:helix-turn-helix domain-containing protein [Arthrobacter sp. FW305-123]